MTQAKILVIEDETDIREMMQFDLRDAGYEVETAADGIVGVAKFGTGAEWDLVLLDQQMPRMDGLEVLRRLRAQDPTSRIIMVTAHATIELASKALQGGAMDFFRKPFSFGTLRSAVRAALARSRQETCGNDEERTIRPFCSLNGYQFRPLPLPASEKETETMRVRRAFEVQGPSGEARHCLVDVTLYVRDIVRAATGHDLAPAHPAWDAVCENALANYLWQQADFSPDTLPIYDLSSQQLQSLREWKS